jgi:prevent-host-death family protein
VESIGVFEAKNHFSEILERVQRGEVVTITKHGKPIAEVRPTEVSPAAREKRMAWLATLEAQKAAFRAENGTVEPWAVADLRRMREERGDQVLDMVAQASARQRDRT